MQENPAESETAEADTPVTRPRTSSAQIIGVAAVVVAVLAALRFLLPGAPPTAPSEPEQTAAAQGRPSFSISAQGADQETLDWMIRSEELIGRLTNQTDDLAFAVRNLQLPDVRTRALFWPFGVHVRDLAPESKLTESDAAATHVVSQGIERRWEFTEIQKDGVSIDLQLWRPLFERVDYFHHTTFKWKSGEFLGDDAESRNEFEGHLVFAGLARLRAGGLAWIRTTQTVRWKLLSGKNPEKAEDWLIASWLMEDASQIEAPAPLFREILDHAIPDLEQRERARLSIHEQYVTERLLAKRAGESFELPIEKFSDISNDRHPGLAITDIDSDGYDDVFVTARWGRAQFFHNQRDGTFREIGRELGLDVDGHSSSAVFADFDNDGDPDLFLGRTLERSSYFENDGGRFVDRSAQRVDGPLPYLASSISATDYDRDGLLDVYVSTYGAISLRPRSGDSEQFLPPHQSAELERRWTQGHRFLDYAGPPNVLLRNTGRGFEIVRDPGALAGWRNTYQTTWTDFDGDGDPDAYLSNDFAPDEMMRNEGNGQFVNVTKELGFDQFGLGMGSSIGDYDRDGRQDIYATSMFSKAGSRITQQLEYLDPRFKQSAQGNYLFRAEGDTFRKVSGSQPQQLDVQRTGWSWGSLFSDVDNDGFLDLAVLNGFYTAPAAVALVGDS